MARAGVRAGRRETEKMREQLTQADAISAWRNQKRFCIRGDSQASSYAQGLSGTTNCQHA
jgi:hypothetical protein